MAAIAYCGLNCAKCVMFNGKQADKAKEILESCNDSGLDSWHSHVPRDENFSYEEFKKGLKWFSKYMHCLGCHMGGGDPNCLIKKCCLEKNVKYCNLCEEFPCEKVKRFKEEKKIDIAKNFEERTLIKS